MTYDLPQSHNAHVMFSSPGLCEEKLVRRQASWQQARCVAAFAASSLKGSLPFENFTFLSSSSSSQHNHTTPYSHTQTTSLNSIQSLYLATTKPPTCLSPPGKLSYYLPIHLPKPKPSQSRIIVSPMVSRLAGTDWTDAYRASTDRTSS